MTGRTIDNALPQQSLALPEQDAQGRGARDVAARSAHFLARKRLHGENWPQREIIARAEDVS
jgi:hypothetical protein